MKHQNKFLWFDLIRGASALLVCAGHLRAAIIVDYGDVRSLTGFHRLFYFVTGLGHQAVMVFFVLSGFSSAVPSWAKPPPFRGGSMPSRA